MQILVESLIRQDKGAKPTCPVCGGKIGNGMKIVKLLFDAFTSAGSRYTLHPDCTEKLALELLKAKLKFE